MGSNGVAAAWAALVLAAMSAGPIGAQTPAPAQSPAPAKPDETKLDLKLFDKAEVDRSKGCSVALWQSNRDPDKDRYAFIFTEALTGQNHARQPARIKVAEKILSMTRVATGGKVGGYGLYPYQLYRLGADEGFAVLDLKLGEIEGEAVEIESGTLTVSMAGKQQARVPVKGGAGCMMAPIAAPPPAAPPPATAAAAPPSNPGGSFSRYTVRPAQIPRTLPATLKSRFGCDPEMLKAGVTGFQMSEESAIWELPCQRFNIQANAVYALVYLPEPAQNLRFLNFKAPPGKKRTSAPAELMSPEWNVKTRTVTGTALGRSEGDCGVHERHRVGADGEFVLVEYREKVACDGKAGTPEQFPLVYRAR
ncbi:DUF1176 domain-containing protein [Bosea sp. (in: a-proteobacteria)]|uniref:DUF1176 domain-containing protein n=1 Tax=Bosea sp. (in: a-proteobacteria) TaxID=1871050 RepID=UPI0027372AF8|nr:DUF1176 domain-containing protein [Bosea sp. (in: a-proteobacteria)]MDP3258137.1 DUF1176 domain-containing protein [Bosea sp. (in: a-proteobacteria)]